MYDTIYACQVIHHTLFTSATPQQDKKDDRLVGIKSTALHFGKSVKLWLSGKTGCGV